jgi:hypothetical protein
MRWELRHILLAVDNFGGHGVSYVPTNIQLLFSPDFILGSGPGSTGSSIFQTSLNPELDLGDPAQ